MPVVQTDPLNKFTHLRRVQILFGKDLQRPAFPIISIKKKNHFSLIVFYMLSVLHSYCWWTLFIKEFTRIPEKAYSLTSTNTCTTLQTLFWCIFEKRRGILSIPYMSCKQSLFIHATEESKVPSLLPTSLLKSQPAAAFIQTQHTLLG